MNPIWGFGIGLWNGVGGKINGEETPYECILREILEETGIPIKHAEFKGIVTWDGSGFKKGGMYVYTAVLAHSIQYETPIIKDEGILHWQSIEWLLDSNNSGIVSNIRHFLPGVLDDNEGCYRYDCCYCDGILQDVKVSPY